MSKTVLGVMGVTMLCASVMTIGATSVAESAQPADAVVDVTSWQMDNASPSVDDGDEATPLAGCQNVTLNVKNNKSVKIKALKIEYKSVEDGKWRTESFADKEIGAGATSTVKSGATLEHIEGHKMSAIKLHYKKWCGGKWSVTYTDTDSTFASPKCVYGKLYRVDSKNGGC